MWKTVHSFIIQSGAIYFDTELNSSETVVKNIYHAFVASAMKFHRHVKALQRTKTVKQEQMVKAVDELTELAYAEIRKFAEKRKRKDGRVGKGGGVVRGNVRWYVARGWVFCCLKTG